MLILKLLIVSSLYISLPVAQKSSACGGTNKSGWLPGKTSKVLIKSGGLERDFLISLPSSYNDKTSVPLIFSFHGRGKDARYQQELSQFSNASFNPNAIAVYPDGVKVCQPDSNIYYLLNALRTTKERGNGRAIRMPHSIHIGHYQSCFVTFMYRF